ncbi:MAG: tetratricopeptide repeat protein [Paludibacteraceae bacterium]|jgi:tetratricopeptide (TPR) repeat protein|nr:tetratricopeptide repeat protein [Paludibacteraceae bacterium]
MEKNKGTQIEEFEKVDEALNKAENFFEKNTSKLLIVVAGICLVVFGVIYYIKCVKGPANEEAANRIYVAEQYFVNGSYEQALNDEENGFLAIIEDHGSTDAAVAAKAYAGVCYKQLGKYEDAIKYLKGVDEDDLISPALQGAVGDCYSELGKDSDAIAFYKKAIASDNELVSPIYMKKLAIVYLASGKKDEAVKLLEDLKYKYGNTSAGREVEKLIEVAKNK